MQIVHANLDGSVAAPALTLARKPRLLSAVIKAHADYTRPFIVALHRSHDLLALAGNPDALGQAIMRPAKNLYRREAEWAATRVTAKDIVTISYLPAGGGGGGGGSGGRGAKSGLAIGASIAALVLAVAAPFAIPFIAGGVSAALGVSATVATAITSVAYAGVVIGLNYLASSASRAKANKDQQDKPLAGVSGGGNLPRPGERIPVGYGRSWRSPDLSQPDYVVNTGADQYLYKRMTVGCGKYSLHKIRVGSLVIWENGAVAPNLAEVFSVELIQPGAVSGLVPGTVTSSANVTGSELPRPDAISPWLGPFRVSPQGVAVTRLQVDYASDGIYQNGPPGSKFAANIYPAEADAWFEYALADSNGNPASSWTRIGGTLLTGSGRQALRFSTFVDVPSGEYLVRARNASARPANGGENTVYWTGLRGHVGDATVRPHVTEIAMRIRASSDAQLNNYSDVEVEVSRLLPCWRGGAFVEMASSKALDAAYDLARNTAYGGAIPDSSLDLTKLAAYVAAGHPFDTFDGWLSGPVSVGEAMAILLGPYRAEPRQVGPIVSFVRDEPSQVRRHHFTRRQILSRTTQDSYKIDRMDGASHLVNEYYVDGDPKRRQEAKATYGPAPVAPRRGSLVGVKDHHHAVHLTRWAAASAFYRYRTVSFDVELNHRLVLPGDACGVDVWYLSNAVTAGVVARSGDVLTLDTDIVWPDTAPASPYLSLLDPTGREFGPMAVTISGRSVTLNAVDRAAAEAAAGISLAGAVGANVDQVPAIVRIGEFTEITKGFIVQSVAPKSWDVATVTCVNDSADVWAAVGATLPPIPAPPTIMQDPPVPTLAWVRGSMSQDAAALVLNWSVDRARGATRFEVEYSLDDQTSWFPLSNGPVSVGQFVLPSATIQTVALRGRGYGALGIPGPWVYGATPARQLELPVSIPDLLPDVVNAFADIQAQLRQIRANINALAQHAIEGVSYNQETVVDLRSEVGEVEASVVQTAQTLASLDTAFAEFQTDIGTRVGEAEADIESTATALSTLNSSFGSFQTSVNARLGDNTANISSVMEALATGDLVSARSLTGVTATSGSLLATGNLQITTATSNSVAEAIIRLMVKVGAASPVEAGMIIHAASNGTFSAGDVEFKANRVRFTPVTTSGARVEISPTTGFSVFNASGLKVVELGLLS